MELITGLLALLGFALVISVPIGAILGMVAFRRAQDLAQSLEQNQDALRRVQDKLAAVTKRLVTLEARPTSALALSQSVVVAAAAPIPVSPAPVPVSAVPEAAPASLAPAMASPPAEASSLISAWSAAATLASDQLVPHAPPVLAPAASPLFELPVALDQPALVTFDAPAAVPAPVPSARARVDLLRDLHRPAPELSPSVPVAAPVPAQAAPRPAPTPTPSARADVSGLESLVGLKLLTWVGLAIVFLGGVFLLKYAYDQDWLGRVITPSMRIALIAMVGAGSIGLGIRQLRRGMVALGQGLMGGGIAAFYLAIYGALQPMLMIVPEALLSPGAGFVLLALATAVGMGLAVGVNGIAVAIIATIGGFATPLLVSTGDNARDAFFAYLLVLDLGVVGAAMWRRWRAVDLLAFAGTVLMFWGWYEQWYHSYEQFPVWAVVAWLGVFHLVFLVLPFIHHWRQGTPVTVERFAMALANLAWGLGFACQMLQAEAPATLSLLCLAGAGLYAGLGVMTHRRSGGDQRTLHGFLALAAMLLTLGLFYLLPVDGITVAWFVEGVLLLHLGFYFGYAPTRWAALAVLALAMLRVAVKHLPGADPAEAFLFNGWLLMLLMAPLGCAAFALVYRRWQATGPERLIAQGCGVAAGLLALAAPALDLARHADGHPAEWQFIPAACLAAVWLACGGVAFMVAARREKHAVFIAGLLPLAVAVTLALFAYADPWVWSYPVLNPRCVAALMVAGALVLFARGARHQQGLIGAPALAGTLAGVAQLLLILIATYEAAAWAQSASTAFSAESAQLLYTAVWLGLAVASALAAQVLGQRRVAVIGLLPLVVGLGSAALLYSHRWGEIWSVLVNGRFIVALLLVGALWWHLATLARLGWLWAGRAAPVATQVALTLLLSVEVLVWCVELSGDADRWCPWSLALVWILAGLAGVLVERRRPGCGSQIWGGVMAVLGALMAMLLYAVGWPADLMYLNLRGLLITGAVAGLLVHGLHRGRATGAWGWGALLMALVAASAEPPAWFHAHIAEPAQADRLSTFSITVVWILAAIAMLAAGFMARIRPLRFAALGLLALTAAKLLLVDMSGSQQLYRILAFIITGLVFVGASWAYHVAEQRLGLVRPAPPDPPA